MKGIWKLFCYTLADQFFILLKLIEWVHSISADAVLQKITVPFVTNHALPCLYVKTLMWAVASTRTSACILLPPGRSQDKVAWVTVKNNPFWTAFWIVQRKYVNVRLILVYLHPHEGKNEKKLFTCPYILPYFLFIFMAWNSTFMALCQRMYKATSS